MKIALLATLVLVLGCSDNVMQQKEWGCPCADGWLCVGDVCRQKCGADSDCATGFECVPQVGACLPSQPVPAGDVRLDADVSSEISGPTDAPDSAPEATAPPLTCWEMAECVLGGSEGCNDVFNDACWEKCSAGKAVALEAKEVEDFRGCLKTHCGSDSPYILPQGVAECIEKECLKDFLSCIQLDDGEDWSCAQIWNCFMHEQCMKQGEQASLPCIVNCTQNASTEAVYRLEGVFEHCPEAEEPLPREELAALETACSAELFTSCYAQSPPLDGMSCREVVICTQNCGCKNAPVPFGEDCVAIEDQAAVQACQEVECLSNLTPESAPKFWEANVCFSNPQANPFDCVGSTAECLEYEIPGKTICGSVVGTAATMQKCYDGNIPKWMLDDVFHITAGEVTHAHRFIGMVISLLQTNEDDQTSLINVLQCLSDEQGKVGPIPGDDAYGILGIDAWLECEQKHGCIHLQ